ncbi:3'-5' exoribonuclease YhaM family protein [Oribacterium sp. WCC10]|uniref:3'-5' exoribonuclease YhaM family protein n=1 Tax=Oribacterium sp. WCC10 TaxID=1855343 RepID=UPI000B860DF0
MKFIETFYDGMRVSDVYLVKTKNTALTKNGKEYLNVTLQDRTGQVDAKVWEPNSPGISDFDVLDYVYVEGNVSVYNGTNQLSIQRLRVAKEGSYEPKNYLPVSSRSKEDMEAELSQMIKSVKNPYLNKLLNVIFVEDEAFHKEFMQHSAAKSVHHGFVGGLAEHTLSVAGVCDFFAKQYPDLHRDLLITAALCHDIGKVIELTAFPKNDYSDAGQLIGHIVIGYQRVTEVAKNIPGFPHTLAAELGHCILSHHGELEYGSPKKPALMEAMALSFADNVDAKLQTMREALDAADKSGKAAEGDGWIGFNRLIDSNMRRTSKES